LSVTRARCAPACAAGGGRLAALARRPMVRHGAAAPAHRWRCVRPTRSS